MMRKRHWRDRKGVSPVIATILMVAITVVLAAVLYVMVMGLGGDTAVTPTGQVTNVEEITIEDVEVYKLTLSVFSPSTKFSNLNVGGLVDGPLALTEYKGGGLVAGTVYFVDNTGDGTVSQGDYLYILKQDVGNDKVVSILYMPSGGVIVEKDLSSS
ncbi:MAG TPA: type IV pilin [Euryarchaeota archaeon]|jgi:flagellin-like protein|nr:type IV pilin [Euryarchaeota archaeon]